MGKRELDSSLLINGVNVPGQDSPRPEINHSERKPRTGAMVGPWEAVPTCQGNTRIRSAEISKTFGQVTLPNKKYLIVPELEVRLVNT